MSELAARQSIEALQQQFAALNDASDWDAVAALFTVDASFSRPSAPNLPLQGREAILQAFRARPAGARRRHLVVQSQVRLLSADRAEASCCSLLFTLTPAGGTTLNVGGFHDTLQLEAEGWRFKSRRGVNLSPDLTLSAALDIHSVLAQLQLPARAEGA